MLPAVAESSGDCSAEETLAGKGKAVAGTPGALKMGRHAPTVAAHGKGTGGVLFVAGFGGGGNWGKGRLVVSASGAPAGLRAGRRLRPRRRRRVADGVGGAGGRSQLDL